MTVLLKEPPSQLALEKPARASEMPHTFTGTLTGAFTVFPEPTAAMPALPLWLPPLAPSPMTVLLAAPPLHPEFAKPASATEMPHRSTGALTGTFTLLPEPTAAMPALPLWLPPLAPSPMTVLLAAPPSQPAFAPPSRATATPQTSIGALTGAFTSLPDRSDSTPALPLSLGPSANAALAGSTKPAVSTAVPIAAEIQRAFFIVLLLFRPAVACATGDADVRRDVSVPGPTAEPLPSVPGAHSRAPSVRRVTVASLKVLTCAYGQGRSRKCRRPRARRAGLRLSASSSPGNGPGRGFRTAGRRPGPARRYRGTSRRSPGQPVAAVARNRSSACPAD